MKPGFAHHGWIEAVCIAVVVATAPRAAIAQQTERHVLRGDRAAIHNLPGEVRLEAGSGPDVVVRISRGGADAARLAIRSGSIGGAETLRVLYPEDDVIYAAIRGGRSTLSVSGDGTLGHGGRRVTIRRSGRGLHAHADLTVSIPAGKRVTLHHGVGRIRVDGVSADLFVDAASAGIVSTGTRGTLDLDTGSGTIDLSAVRADEVRLDTGSGAVRLELLSDVRLLDVDTGSGSVTVSVPDQLGAGGATSRGGMRRSAAVLPDAPVTGRVYYYRQPSPQVPG